MSRWGSVAAACLLVAACSSGSDGGRIAGPEGVAPGTTGAASSEVIAVAPSGDGNGYVSGTGRLAIAAARVVAVDAEPVRLLALDGDPPGFVVVGSDGSLTGVDVDVADGDAVDVSGRALTAVRDQAGEAAIGVWEVPNLGDHAPLVDATPTVSSTGVMAVLADPTDRYPHGILGDRFEAAALVLVDLSGGLTVIEAPAPGVSEDLRPTWADVDGDGTQEVLVTVSGAGAGAQVVAYSPAAAEIVTETPVLATPNRWRHRIGVAPLGDDGDPVYVEVVTPHIGGDLTLRVVSPDGLERTSSTAPFASHEISSRDLDGGRIFDADGDGDPEIVVPDGARESLVVFDVGDGELAVSTVIPLGGRLSTGIAVAVDGGGDLTVAVGTRDGRVLVWDA